MADSGGFQPRQVVQVQPLRIIEVGQQPLSFDGWMIVLFEPRDQLSLSSELPLAGEHMPLGHLQLGLIVPHVGCPGVSERLGHPLGQLYHNGAQLRTGPGTELLEQADVIVQRL
jgi:hypothetical protein